MSPTSPRSFRFGLPLGLTPITNGSISLVNVSSIYCSKLASKKASDALAIMSCNLSESLIFMKGKIGKSEKDWCFEPTMHLSLVQLPPLRQNNSPRVIILFPAGSHALTTCCRREKCSSQSVNVSELITSMRGKSGFRPRGGASKASVIVVSSWRVSPSVLTLSGLLR